MASLNSRESQISDNDNMAGHAIYGGIDNNIQTSQFIKLGLLIDYRGA